MHARQLLRVDALEVGDVLQLRVWPAQHFGRAGCQFLVRADEVELLAAEVDPPHCVPHGSGVVRSDLLATEVSTSRGRLGRVADDQVPWTEYETDYRIGATE